MSTYNEKYSTEKYYFKETPFQKLMQKRVTEVLLVCSKYDKFMLEEDGRIEGQLFQEYVSLHLRYPPRITQVSSARQAFKILDKKYFDLVITMLNIRDIQAFDLAKQIKETYPDKPIVVLTHFSREVSLFLEKEDLSCIDYVFSWLGNANILMAIVKLIEDKMNVDYDVNKVGVQTIILVEDSIRYYSSYLPTIYRILFQQAFELMSEGLNEHQQTMRMRGRPKILLANNFEDAMELYEKYKDNLLGVISDITYEREGKLDKTAGLKLCLNIRNENKYLPILLQSSQEEHEKNAYLFDAGFIHKNSKTLLQDIRNYIKNNFGFGAFSFKDSQNMKEIGKADNLRQLQRTIKEIPDSSIEYHVSLNHFSKWFKARGLFSLANLIKNKQIDDFQNVRAIKDYLFDTIKNYRSYKGKGTIAIFDKTNFDEYAGFTRIGQGSLGGKARGLAFIDSFLKRRRLAFKYSDTIIKIPKTLVLTTDIFEDYMSENNLEDLALSDISDDEILKHFLKAKLPERITEDLYAILSVIKTPMAIRSSSLMEDSHYQPFAGVYATYMIPNSNEDVEIRFKELSDAVKSVYASTFYKSSKDYMLATHNLIDEEKMAVIIQEISGKQYGDKFYPTFSGVARSLNFYPIEKEKPDEGIANVALGLGKIIVEGGVTLRFSPRHPRKIIQLHDTKSTIKLTQKKFYSLDMSGKSFEPTTDEACNLRLLDISEAEKDNSIKYLASSYDRQNDVIRDGVMYPGRKLITFASILKYKMFPLAEILIDLLRAGSREMNTPVEIEFAVNLDTPAGQPNYFHFLQIRPIVQGLESDDINITENDKKNAVIYAETALGNGFYDDIYDIIYVKPDSFNPKDTVEIASCIEELNNKMKDQERNYILIGPGRWGSTDPWLGIPVKWAQISNAKIIVESGLKDFRIDASQGSHFFQNITSFRIGYLTINPFINDGSYDVEYLNSLDAEYENEFLRHVRCSSPLFSKLDGKKSMAVIRKPGVEVETEKVDS